MKKNFVPALTWNIIRIAFCLALIFVSMSFTPETKVTICHVPPGNPGNCHEITISRNALQAHLDHGDRLYCYEPEQYTEYLGLVQQDASRILKMY